MLWGVQIFEYLIKISQTENNYLERLYLLFRAFE